MARKTDIRLRRSATAGNKPSTSDLNLGELALNTYDGAVFLKTHDGSSDAIAVAADARTLSIDYDNKRVGIGTTSPSYKLNVQTAASDANNDWPALFKSYDDKAGIIISDNDTSNYLVSRNSFLSIGSNSDLHANNLNVKSTGEVGIGTITPSHELVIRKDQAAGTEVSIVNLNDNDNASALLRFRNHTSGSETASGAYIQLNKFNAFRIWNQFGNPIIFGTNNTEKMRLTSDGNLGIGTNNPTEPLSIHHSDPKIKLLDTDGTQQVGTIFQAGSMLGIQSRDGSSNGLIKFQGYNGTTGQEYARFTASGNFGIGTGSPTGGKLVVQTVSGEYGLRLQDNSSHYFRVAHGGATEIAGDVTINAGLRVNHNPVILDTNPASTYGVSEALRIDDSAGTNDRALQIFELQHSGGRSHRLTFNTNITTDGSAYTYTQGNYGGSSQIEFANNGEIVFYTHPQDTGGSATAITPIERFRVNSDGDIRFESGNLFYDASANALNFIDNVYAQFGSSNDLQIFHDGSNSIIKEAGTGNLRLQTGNAVQFRNGSGADLYFNATLSGATTLFHNKVIKLATTTTGINVTGNITNTSGNFEIDTAGNISFDADSGQVEFKDNGVLKSLIDFTGDNVEIQSRVTDGDLLFRGQDGGSFITALTLDMSEAGAATFNSTISSGAITSTGLLKLDYTNPTLTFRPDNSAHFNIKANESPARLELGHSNNKNLYLSNTGNATFNYNLTVEGNLTVNGTTTTINSTTLDVDDLNITVAKGAADSAAANGGGLTIDGAGASLTWSSSNSNFALSHGVDVAGNIKVGSGGASAYNRLSFVRAGGAGVGAIGWHSDSKFYVAGHPSFGPTAGNDVRVYGFGNDIHIGDNSNGDVITVQYSSGNVGIGTTSPSSGKLVVSGAKTQSGGAPIGNILVADSTALAANVGGGITFQGVYHSGGNITGLAAIEAMKETATHNEYGGALVLKAREDQGAMNEVARFTSTGNLQFSKKGSSFVSPGFTYHTNNYLYLRGGSAGLILADDSNLNTVQIIDGSSGYINFETGDGSSRMRITSTGNVGIGTTSPSTALEIGDGSGSPILTLNKSTTGESAIDFDNAGNIKAKIALDSDENLQFKTGGTPTERLEITEAGVIKFNNAYTFPTSDGSAGHVLKTDGSGTLSFGTVSAGAATALEDTDGDTKIQVEETSDDDIIRFDTGGTERVVISSNGLNIKSGAMRIAGTNVITSARNIENVGTINFGGALRGSAGSATKLILNATTARTELHSAGTSGMDFRDNGNNPKMTMDGNGNLGIGTTAPQSKLETNLHSGADSSLMNANSVNDVHLIRAGFGQNAASTSNAGAKWGLRFVGRNDNNYDNGKSGAIFGVSEDSLGYNRKVGLAFHTSAFDASHAERMRINADGNVGIGTTSPARKLHVVGSGATIAVKAEATDGNQSSLDLKNSEGEFRLINDGGSLSIYDQTDTAERFRINTSGNVGIGTSSPSQALHVVGNGLYTGGLTVGDSAADTFITRGHTHLATSGNNVGIGTTSPDFKLDVTGATGAYSAGDNIIGVFQSATDHQTALKIKNTNTNASASAPRAALDLDTADHEAGSGARLRAQFTLRSNASSGSGGDTSITVPKDLRFFVNNKGTLNDSSGEQASSSTVAGTEALRITDQGNVGVGITNPQNRLHVAGPNSASQLLIENTSAAGGTAAQIQFKPSSARNAGPFIRSTQRGTGANDGDLNFGDENGIIMTLNGAAKAVGIGTISPDTNLDITTAGVAGLIMNQDTGNAAVSARMFFKDQTRTNGFLNVNGVLEVRTGMVLGSTSGTKIIGVGPTQVEITTPVLIEEYQIDTVSTTTSSTSQAVISQSGSTVFRSCRYTVQITNSTDSTYHTTELLLVHDGTTANITEFGTIFTGAAIEATFDADINSGNIRLLATPASGDTMVFKVVRHSITV